MIRFLRPSFATGTLVMALALPAHLASASTPSVADPTLTTTDGVRTLTVSKSRELDGSGDSVTVEGAGYDTTKGIYVALCVRTPKGTAPTPCGGGADRAGTGGASVWISSNPPAYGVKLAIPYGPNGSFRVEFAVGPRINDTIDCRAVECAIVTKSDHTIYSDRSQDLEIPVTFTGTAPAPTEVPATSPASAPVTADSAVRITTADNLNDLAAAATGDSSSGKAIVIGVGAAVVIALAVIVAMTRRKKSR